MNIRKIIKEEVSKPSEKELTDSYIRAVNKSYGKSQGTFGHG